MKGSFLIALKEEMRKNTWSVLLGWARSMQIFLSVYIGSLHSIHYKNLSRSKDPVLPFEFLN